MSWYLPYTNTSLYSGYAYNNNMRLLTILSQKSNESLQRINALSNSAASGSSNAGTNTSAGSALSADSVDFLKKYQNHMLELKDAAEKALSGDGASRLSAEAVDSDIADVSGELIAASDSFTLTVDQLAKGQVNRSAALAGSDPLPSMSGTLRLETSKGAFDFYMSAAGSNNNREMLDNFAAQLNARQTGVTASVEEQDGKAALRLEGETGEGNAFTVSGTLAERLGFGEAEQTAQDAVYSIQKNDGPALEMTSGSNDIEVTRFIKATLKKEGATEIEQSDRDSSGMADSLSKMVDQFNKTLDFLNENEDRGIGVLNQIRRMILPPTSEASMNFAGLTIKSDGSLSFDRETFLSRAEQSPELVGSIYQSIANGLSSDARMGMQESSANLVGTVQYFQRLNDFQQNPLNFFSIYNRSGSYNFMNLYAVGLLMSLNA